MDPKLNWPKRAEDAANWLTETDVQIAELKVKHERDKRKAKRVWSAIFLRVTGNVEERKSQATCHADFQSAEAAEMTSLLEMEKLRNRRDTADTIIEFWRSWNKAKTEGQI